MVEDGKILGMTVSTDFLRYFSGEAFKLIESGTIEEALSKEIGEVIGNSSVLKYNKPLVFKPGDKISELVEAMLEKGAGSALVAENGSLQGIITERDLMRFLYENM